MVALRQFSTKDWAYFLSVVITRVRSSVALMVSLALSLVNPNWVRMKDGVFSSSTARRSENAASSAVNGLPEWNLTPSRMVRVKVRPSSLTVHDVARPG